MFALAVRLAAKVQPDFDPVLNYAVEDDVTPNNATANVGTVFGPQLTEIGNRRNEPAFLFDLLDSIRCSDRLVPRDVIEDIGQVLFRRRRNDQLCHLSGTFNCGFRACP